MSRKLILHNDNKDSFLELVGSGMSKEDACEKVGIQVGTVRTWLSRDPDFYKRWHKLARTSAVFHAPGAVERLALLVNEALVGDKPDFKTARRCLKDLIEIAQGQTGNLTVNADSISVTNLVGASTEELMEALSKMAGSGEAKDIVEAEGRVVDGSEAGEVTGEPESPRRGDSEDHSNGADETGQDPKD